MTKQIDWYYDQSGDRAYIVKSNHSDAFSMVVVTDIDLLVSDFKEYSFEQFKVYVESHKQKTYWDKYGTTIWCGNQEV